MSGNRIFALQTQFLHGTPVDEFKDMWNVALQLYPFMAAAGEFTVVSSDAADAAAGTGIRTVELFILNAAFEMKQVTVILNGTTPVVVSGGDWYRVLDMVATTAGSGGVAAGVIDLIGDSNVLASIAIGNNSSSQLVYTVPKSASLALIDFDYFLYDPGNLQDGHAQIVTRAPVVDAPWVIFKGTEVVSNSNLTSGISAFAAVFPIGTDVKVQSISSDAGAEFLASLTLGFKPRSS